MSYDLFGTKIQDTYQRLLQVTSGNTIVDGHGNDVTITATINGTGSTYTPNITNVSNLSSSTAYECQYILFESTCTVSGKVTIGPISVALSTILGISLPITSDLQTDNNCCGVAFCPSVAGQGASILGDAINDRALLQFISSNLTSQDMFFNFTYKII